MTFDVHPPALRSFATLIRRQGDHVSQAMRPYAIQEIEHHEWEGMLSALGSVYEKVQADLITDLDNASKLLNGFADNLATAAKAYETTDRRTAAKIDSTLHFGSRQTVAPEIADEPGEPFAEHRPVDGRLLPVGNYDAQFRWQMEVLDLLGVSITSAVRQIVIAVSDWDPFEPIMKEIVGDWARARSLADAWHNLSYAFNDLGDNVIQGAKDLVPHWSGAAAGNALTYLERLGAGLHGRAELCRFVRDKLTEAADGAAKMYQGISSIVDSIADKAIAAAAAAGAGTATIEFFGIGAIGWVVAGFVVDDLIADVAKVANKISDFKAYFDSVTGLIGDIAGGSFDGYKTNPLPQEPYTLPKVGK